MSTPDSIRAVIVDDERLARRALAHLLAPLDGIELVGEAGRINEAVSLIDAVQPDLIFLDVQMRGETGFDLLDQANITCPVIFVTAFDAYAVRAFEVNALDYLLKPVDLARLEEALDRIHKPLDTPAPPSATFTYDDLFFYEDQRRARFIRIRDIAFIRAAQNYTEVHLRDTDTALVLKPLTAWEDQLPDAHFVRVHRSLLINIACIERIEREPGGGYALSLKGFTEPLPMSRRRATALKTRLAP